MLATNDGSKVTDSWTLRHILYSKVGNFLGRKLQLIKWSLWPGFPKLSLFNFLTECSCCGGIMRKDLHLLESGPWTLGLIEEHLQLGFITKQKLWTDNQLSIENETIGDKEDVHDWRETFRQNICILPPSALISFKTFSVSFYQNDFIWISYLPWLSLPEIVTHVDLALQITAQKMRRSQPFMTLLA